MKISAHTALTFTFYRHIDTSIIDGSVSICLVERENTDIRVCSVLNDAYDFAGKTVNAVTVIYTEIYVLRSGKPKLCGFLVRPANDTLFVPATQEVFEWLGILTDARNALRIAKVDDIRDSLQGVLKVTSENIERYMQELYEKQRYYSVRRQTALGTYARMCAAIVPDIEDWRIMCAHDVARGFTFDTKDKLYPVAFVPEKKTTQHYVLALCSTDSPTALTFVEILHPSAEHVAQYNYLTVPELSAVKRMHDFFSQYLPELTFDEIREIYPLTE